MNNQLAQNNLLGNAATFARAARRDMVSACANALCAAACIFALREVSGQSLTAVIDRVDVAGVSRATLFRWANAYQTACVIMGVRELPAYMSEGWAEHLEGLKGVAEGMTIGRLQLGAPSSKGDLARLDQLQTGLETAEDEAEEAIYANALSKVECGEWSLIDALRAVGSQAAQERATERRREPVYFEIDGKGKPAGLMPKAMASIAVGFKQWERMSGQDRLILAQLWQELVRSAPAELKKGF